MRERMRFKDIRLLAKERAKEDLNTLILMEVIIVIISMGIVEWARNLVTLLPFVPFALLIQTAEEMLTNIFWAGNIFACMMVTLGMKAKVEYIFYVFQRKLKEILWLLLRKILVTYVYMVLFLLICNALAEMFQLDTEFMKLIAKILAIIVVELRYFPALYLLLDGEEQKCGLSVRRGISMMHGNYLRLVAFWFSCIPWMLIGVLLCGVGLFVIAPWIQVSLVILYMELKQQEKIRMRKKAAEDNEQISV